MFSSKKCKNCGKKVSDEWEFCPFCGEEVETERVFDDIEKEFKNIDKMFGSEFFKFPKIAMRPSGGISITISSGFGNEPKIEVKAPSGYKNLEPEIKRNLDVGPSTVLEKKTVRVPKCTEEPETSVQNVENKKIISIKLPGVRSEDDIEIKKLEQSIEVKAFTDKKAYFTLVPIPSNLTIASKRFKNDVLVIELEKQ